MVSAKNPIQCPFGPFSFGIHYFPNENKEFISFQKLCKNGKYNAKTLNKVRTEYERICNLYPENKVVAQCVMGNYLLHYRGENKGLQEEGLELLKSGVSLLPDTTSVTGEQKKKLKILAGAIYNQIGCAYLMGVGATKNVDMAFYYFQKERIYWELSAPLSFCYLLGIGTNVDEGMARKLMGNYSLGNFFLDNHVYADFELLLYALRWNREHQIDNETISVFKDGYLKWHIDKDYDGAYNAFIKAIDMGYQPAMCEIAMLFLDEEWTKSSEKQFESWIQDAINVGFAPAAHIIGRKFVEHWDVKIPFSSGGQGKAYPYFQMAAQMGYQPSIDALEKYEKGIYTKKGGLAAALNDLNEGWKGGDENSPGLLEGALDIGAEVKRRVSSPSGSTSTNTNVRTKNTVVNSSSNVSSSTYNYSSSVDNTNSRSSTSKTYNNTKKTYNSTVNSGVSSSSKNQSASTRNCRKCGGSGKVTCHRCNGTTRMTCVGCSGKGYILVTGAGKRTCSYCSGKGHMRCQHCYGRKTEKCVACNGSGKVRN